MLGFMYCISFHCSIDGVDAFFEGGERRAGVAVDGSDPFAADQPIRRAGSKKKKLHNNLLSSSGGSVYLTKSSQGCRIYFVFCCR